jgi:hypothetical protein
MCYFVAPPSSYFFVVDEEGATKENTGASDLGKSRSEALEFTNMHMHGCG